MALRGHTWRFTWKDALMLLAACAAAFAFIKATVAQNDQVAVAKQVSQFNAAAICRQSQVLIGLSLEGAKTDVARKRILRLSQLYLDPVNDAREKLGLSPCVIPDHITMPKEKK